jgi:dynein heavy chain, axonemal
MDDNRLLTLPNGERIRLQKTCSLLFEVADLRHASPATVSRCGMVYIDPVNTGYKPYFQSWVAKRGKNEGDTLKGLFDKYISASMDYIFEGEISRNFSFFIRSLFSNFFLFPDIRDLSLFSLNFL